MLLLAVGAGSAVYGVLFALGQHDLKRLLAYHSVENIGIIVMGLGLALIGVSAKQPAWAALGLAGCLLHVWNHALFKGLLFLAAGSVIHGAGTREIDRLGGLARPMARTASLFAIGAAAICGLPPLNGFVSELLIYLGLLRVGGDGIDGAWSVAPLAVPLLAMAGALAIACFVKVFGTRVPRADAFRAGRAGARVAAGDAPRDAAAGARLHRDRCAARPRDAGRSTASYGPGSDWTRRPLRSPSSCRGTPLMAMNAVLVVGVLGVALALRRRSRRRTPAQTRDVGLRLRATRLRRWRTRRPRSRRSSWVSTPGCSGRAPRAPSARELFPAARSFHTSVPEQVLEGVLAPLWAGFRRGR